MTSDEVDTPARCLDCGENAVIYSPPGQLTCMDCGMTFEEDDFE